MKTIRVKMTDGEGKTYIWTVHRVPRAINYTMGHKPRIVSGWEYVSNDGCVRFSEGNWIDLVADFRLTANNYGMTTNIS